jgi:hypothetical protein
MKLPVGSKLQGILAKANKPSQGRCPATGRGFFMLSGGKPEKADWLFLVIKDSRGWKETLESSDTPGERLWQTAMVSHSCSRGLQIFLEVHCSVIKDVVWAG